MLPDPVGGSDARHEAARELARPIYHRDEPNLLQRIVDWVVDWLGHLLGRVVETAGSGPFGLIVVLLLIAGIIALIVRLTGAAPVRDLLAPRTAAERRRTAADERAEAQRQAGLGHHDEAIRCTTRALVRELEERGVLDPTPGRTPAGIAREVARTVPRAAADTRAVTDAFEAVWYGHHAATPELWATARDAEARVRGARLVVSA